MASTRRRGDRPLYLSTCLDDNLARRPKLQLLRLVRETPCYVRPWLKFCAAPKAIDTIRSPGCFHCFNCFLYGLHGGYMLLRVSGDPTALYQKGRSFKIRDKQRHGYRLRPAIEVLPSARHSMSWPRHPRSWTRFNLAPTNRLFG